MTDVYVKIPEEKLSLVIATRTKVEADIETGEETTVQVNLTVADYFQFPIPPSAVEVFVRLYPVRANHCIYPEDEPTQAQITEWMQLLGVTDTYTFAEVSAIVANAGM